MDEKMKAQEMMKAGLQMMGGSMMMGGPGMQEKAWKDMVAMAKAQMKKRKMKQAGQAMMKGKV